VMGESERDTDFDSLFITDEADQNALVAKQQLSYVTSRPGSGHMTPQSRGSPSRRQQGGSCKHAPGVGLLPGQAQGLKHSHSMRDQTSHMKEKYQARYQHRRLSIRTPNSSNNNTPKGGGSRNNSLTTADVEITRQFLATNNKVINRGDSFRRREKCNSSVPQHVNSGHQMRVSPSVEIRVQNGDFQNSNKGDKAFRIAFLGGREVGKTSIIDQFMSSEHADVYENNKNDYQEDVEENDKDQERLLTVDVNNLLTQLSLVEISQDSSESLDLDVTNLIEDFNPDCFILVYAVDDRESFELSQATLLHLTENNHLAGKKCILVGAKSDLVRSRLVSPAEGCHVAMTRGVKFSEISAGVGDNVDTLLVGIVLQCRMNTPRFIETSSTRSGNNSGGNGGGLMQTLHSVFSKVLGGNQQELKKQCMNLHI